MFNVGDKVALKSSPNVYLAVIKVIQEDHENSYIVLENNQEKEYYETQLIKIDQKNDFNVNINFLKSAITSFHILSPSLKNLFSFRSGKIQFVPYQYRPVLKLLRSDTPRMLIADEVGVGKTIETGLIIKELKARRKINSILVICPKPLVTEKKWYQEMKRFDEEFIELNGDQLRFCIQETYLDGDWPDTFKQCIMPYSLFDSNLLLGKDKSSKNLKTKSLLDLNPPVKFDLVIVDEAHNAKNPDSYAYGAVRYFCDNADAVLLLTATPIQMGNHDLFNLLNLLRPDLIIDETTFKSMAEPNQHITKTISICRTKKDLWIEEAKNELIKCQNTEWGRNFLCKSEVFLELENKLNSENINDFERLKIIRDLEELYTFNQLINRTRRRDIQKDYFCIRKPQTVETDFTDQQRKLYDAIIDITYKFLTKKYEKTNPNFFMTTIQRQASSSLFGLEPLLKDLLEQKSIELDIDEGIGDDDVSIDNSYNELDEDILSILSLLDNIDKFDPKFEKLKEILLDKAKQEKNKTLLFSTYIHTLKYLENQLQGLGLRVGLIYGNVRDSQRVLIKERFQLPKENPEAIDVLLSSEIGCEGLDFQFCDLLVNYDIPWNPMRIEQRIGRIDRFGQESETVVIINFITPNTIDAEIYNRCFMRIGIFESAIGSSEEILGSITKELSNIASNFKLTAEEKTKKIQQLSDNEIRNAQEMQELEDSDAELFGLNLPTKNWEDDLKQAESSWLSSQSIRNIVEEYLQNLFSSEKKYILGDKDTHSLRLSKEERQIISAKMDDRNKLKNDKLYRQFSNWLSSDETFLPITFDYKSNVDKDNVNILNVLHPLVVEAANFFEITEPIKINLNSSDDEMPKGIFPFGIYSWKKVGINESWDIVTVCEDQVIEKNLLKLINKSETNTSSELIADDKISMIKKRHHSLWTESLKKFQSINKKIIDQKIETLKISYNARTKNTENIMNKINNEKILAMRKGELNRSSEDFNLKLEQLENNFDKIDIIQSPLVYGTLEVS